MTSVFSFPFLHHAPAVHNRWRISRGKPGNVLGMFRVYYFEFSLESPRNVWERCLGEPRDSPRNCSSGCESPERGVFGFSVGGADLSEEEKPTHIGFHPLQRPRFFEGAPHAGRPKKRVAEEGGVRYGWVSPPPNLGLRRGAPARMKQQLHRMGSFFGVNKDSRAGKRWKGKLVKGVYPRMFLVGLWPGLGLFWPPWGPGFLGLKTSLPGM